jgi:alpha-L-fucosidase 2
LCSPPAPFQVDGNFGGVAGVAEALVQSHEYVKKSNCTAPPPSSSSSSSSPSSSSSGWNSTTSTSTNTTLHLKPAYWGDLAKTPLLRLLPALPTQWAASGGGGSVSGLRVRGGFEVDVAWDGAARLTKATVRSLLGGEVWITLGDVPLTAAGDAAAAKITVDGPGGGSGGSGLFVLVQTVKGGSYEVTLAA